MFQLPATAVIALFFLFITKHFVVDFLLQQPYQYLNKGKYGHPGGILHAFLHIIGTFIILLPFALFYNILNLCIGLAVIEGIIHYHIDYAKVSITAKLKWRCNETDNFWYLMGFDQYLHYLTYIVIVGGILCTIQ